MKWVELGLDGGVLVLDRAAGVGHVGHGQEVMGVVRKEKRTSAKGRHASGQDSVHLDRAPRLAGLPCHTGAGGSDVHHTGGSHGE